MAANLLARALATALLESSGSTVPVRRCLNEGTIIILHGDEAQNSAALNKLVHSERGEPMETGSQTHATIKDRFDIKRAGKRWHFTVYRNEEGQISGIDVEET